MPLQAIDKYRVILQGKSDAAGAMAGWIHCYRDGSNVMSCGFHNGTVPENNETGRVNLHYPSTMLPVVIDVLRNEKPAYFSYDDITKAGYVSTHREPVGEEES
jgi:hypothetical protein